MYILLKQLKKILAMLLSIMILITALPVFAFADEFEKTANKAAKAVAEVQESEEPETDGYESSGETEDIQIPEEEPEDISGFETEEKDEVPGTELVENIEGTQEEPEETEYEAEEETQPQLTVRTIELCQGLEIYGLLPAAAVAEAVPVSVEIYGEEVLAAFDICIYEDEEQMLLGNVWQPEEGTITVRMSDSAFGSEELNVYHTPEGGEPQLVTTVGAVDGTVEFEAESFSVWTVSRSIDKVIETGDGNSYLISVVYGKDAGIPDDSELSVSELSGEDYADHLGRAAVLMNAAGFEYARIFDISISDPDGNEIQPSSAVQVHISLLDDSLEGEPFSVVHFGDPIEEIASGTEGNTVSFTATGFSAYAIVQAPSAASIGWRTVSSMAELWEKAGDGLYISHVKGYYFMNSLTKDGGRTGITKTKPAQSYPHSTAALYYFEPVEGSPDKVYVYCMNGTARQYVKNENNNSLTFGTSEDKTAFTVSVDDGGRFRFNNGPWYWNMQGGENGKRFCSYNSANDENNFMYLWYYEDVTEDPYGFDGKSYGLMSWNGGTAGKAMMAIENGGSLEAMALTVMTNNEDQTDKLFVPNDSDISMWTFSYIDRDRYYLTTVADGSTKYLRVDSNGLSLVSTPDDNCKLTVVPGSGIHEGELSINCGGIAITYIDIDSGFSTGGSVGSEWLRLVDYSELTSDYFMTYSARKVSVSSEEITNGSRIIVYTRTWDEATQKYIFYAIDSDGNLVRCYESGDSIQWVGGIVNTLLWNLVEYYNESTGAPNYYYELYNQYSEKYIAPQLTGEQILSDDTIGINLNGRRNGYYYSTIIAWDETEYKYAGLKVENGHIVPCAFGDAIDFYFAIVQDLPVDDQLTTVPTVDHRQYGITMKIKDIGTRAQMSNFLGSDVGGAVHYTVPNLLSTALGNDGYPSVTSSGASLGGLYTGARDVNHIFIASTYSGSGYYEFDSTQNYAHLQDDNNFVVYKEIATHDTSAKNTLQHGQFFPFNDIQAGVFASVNRYNLYDAEGDPLPDSDPRKYEQLYLISNPDYFFAVEIEASFTQTPDGLDNWGHDIIYEFTGDDDFWLYVDGELIIDLGGIHSALPGSVNYSTGDVYVNGTHTTLKDLFYNNYIGRGHSAAEAEEYVNGYFEQNDQGKWVFKEYSTHTMKIFYMERGAGASNLHMKFNLASVKPGSVLLSKELSGIDDAESMIAEFPYQIFYRVMTENGIEERQLSLGEHGNYYVYYKDTVNPAAYRENLEIDGTNYQKVFMLKPGDIVEISFPRDTESTTMLDYRIVECGVNTQVYSSVKVNGTELAASDPDELYSDFALDWASTKERARTAFVNTVNPDALRNLTVKKILFDETGHEPLPDDTTQFGFRIYFGTDFSSELSLADMYTYHVKDSSGNYCRWDNTAQSFVSLGEGRNDYALLSDAEKELATFHTSMNGSVSRIPGFFTVEFRNLLAGTRFMVEERDYEIPDGYSLQKYIYYDDVLGGEGDDNRHESEEPVGGTFEFGRDPHVDVCNLRGWGLRVYKQWSDSDYIDERDPVYFGIFKRIGSDLILVEDSLRRLEQGEETVYWYYLHIPDTSVPFEDYLIEEVKLTGSGISVDDDGVVSGYDDIYVIGENDEIGIRGKQKGETESSEITYTVLYSRGEIEDDSHVRVDTVTNNRPGIVLEKQDLEGHPISGATFVLKDDLGNLIGEFVSGGDGLITVAFLRDNIPYTLTETKVPQGYYGLQQSMTIVLQNGTVSVSGVDQSLYVLTQETGTTPSLVIKNIPRIFTIVKKDGATDALLPGVHFALHKQVTVGDVTIIDLNPMPGYEDISSGEDGTLPIPASGLPPGTYELRETGPPNGYLALGHIQFTISETGAITLGSHPSGTSLSFENDAGSVTYIITIYNYPIMPAPTGYTGSAHTALYMAIMTIGLMLAITHLIIRLRFSRNKDPDPDDSPPGRKDQGETRAGPQKAGAGGIPGRIRGDTEGIAACKGTSYRSKKKVNIYLKGIKTMKTMKKIGALLLAMIMIMSCGSVIFATTLGTNGEQGAFTEKDTPVSQSKVLVLEKELKAYNADETAVKAPTITYNYAIAPATVAQGTTVTDSGDKHVSGNPVSAPVKAGIGNLTATVSWTNADTLTAATDGAKNVKDVSVDFSNVVFTGAGVYRYVITESLASGFTYASSGVTETTGEHSRFIDVYVRPVETGFNNGLTAAEWDIYGFTCFYNNTSITDGDKTTAAVKTTGFVDGTTDGSTAFLADQYYTFNVVISKTVVNDAYGANTVAFPFTVLFTNDAVTQSVDVIGNIESATVTGWTDPAAGVLSSTNGIVNIKSGGSVKYIGIPNGTAVEVYETNIATGVTYQVETELTTSAAATIKDASVTWGDAPTSAVTQAMSGDPASKTNAFESTKATFATTADQDDDNLYAVAVTNTLVTISPTGVSLRVAPYILMLAAGVFMLFFSRRRREVYED